VQPKYSFRPGFEQGVAFHLATNATFAGRYMEHLSEDLFGTSQGKFLYKLVKSEMKTTGAGPRNFGVFEQRVFREYVEGRLKLEDHDAAIEFVVMGSLAYPDTNYVDAELARTLQNALKGADVNDLMMVYSKKGDIKPILAKLLANETIGKKEAKPRSFGLDKTFYGYLRTEAALVRVLVRGGIGLAIGGTGGGKSMFMSQIAATGLVCALNVAYISLEISPGMVGRRIMAALSGLPIDFVTEYQPLVEAVIAARGNVRGILRQTKLPGLGTTVLDIRNQLKEWCSELGITAFDIVIVDYVDRIAGLNHIEKDMSSYELGEKTMQGLRDIAEEQDCVVWTPSQAARMKNQTKQDIGVDDTAGSMHKPRIADTVISINNNQSKMTVGRQDQMEVVGKIIKDRNSRGNLKTPAVPPLYAYGHVFPSTFLPLYNPKLDWSNEDLADLWALRRMGAGIGDP
jgi:KaiC/GvpD/RAD55 family RecA-like ATPase